METTIKFVRLPLDEGTWLLLRKEAEGSGQSVRELIETLIRTKLHGHLNFACSGCGCKERRH
jgi:hypothetical protein